MAAKTLVLFSLFAHSTLLPELALPPETGVATLHKAMESVLSVYPERRRPDLDGYIGVVECSDLGKEYLLTLRDRVYHVAAVDCLSSQHYEVNRSREWCIRSNRFAALCPGGKYRWLVDVDERLWDGPEIPQVAHLQELLPASALHPADVLPSLTPPAELLRPEATLVP